MNRATGRFLPLAAITLGLSGCNLEIWEGEVLTASGETLFQDTFFSEAACQAETAERLNALSTEGRKKITYSRGDWVEQEPQHHLCRLKHKFGF